MRKLNLKDKKFGKLVAQEYIASNKKGKTSWKCLCECGKIKIILTNQLTSGQTKSCGCLYKEIVGKKLTKNMCGLRFGRLVVLKRAITQKDHHAHWLCKCDCGNMIELNGRRLRTGNTTSCGCFRYQASLEENMIACYKKINTSKNQKDRYTRNSVRWRIAVYERDGFKCQCCDKVGGGLHAHHILSWHAYPDKRYDIDNGITLCVDCHRYKVHKFKKKIT